ncbi:unnamed protein product [Schistosoma curassoni]|nr:unnamed protein product [Schistosoma curassoni]
MYILHLTGIFPTLATTTTTSTSTTTIYGQQRCMKPVLIQIPECQNTFYNYTGMPNLIGQETQFDARHQLQTFKPLITYKCSSKLNFFLCSIYTPMCDVNTHYLIGPCRPLCEHVRARCAPFLRVFDFNWPENLNCSRFPIKNSVGGAMCMEGPEDLEEDINSLKSAISSSSINNNLELNGKFNKPNHKDLPLDPSMKQMLQVINLDNEKINNNQMKEQVTIKETQENEEQLELNQIMEKLTSEFLINKQFLPNTLITSHINKYPLSLPQLAQSIRYCSHFKKSIFYVYINRTGRCAPLCESNILYTTEAKHLSIMWTSILAGICSLMTIFTLIRYIMNLKDFRFNEKPIIYIALCQLFYALGFGLSLILGQSNVTCGQDLDSGQRIRLQEGLDNGLCVFIFIIQYFFSIASYIWWTMLVIHWALQRISMITSCIGCCNTHPLQLSNNNNSGNICSNDNKQLNHIDELNTESNCYCFPINSFCFCSENSLNWNQSEIIMNERLMHPSTKKHHASNNNNNNNNTLKNPALNTTPTNVKQQYQPNFQNTLNQTITNGMKRDNDSWSTTINHHYHNHDYCQQQRYSMMFTSKSDQVSACLTREHVVAWLTAGLFTVGVLVSRQVDADELIPVCGVGRQNTNVLGAFILGPQTVLITLGGVAFTIGFLCLLPCFRKCKCFYWSQCNTNGNQSSRHHSLQYKKRNYNHGIDGQSIDGNPTLTRSMVNRSHHHYHRHHHHYQPTSHNTHQPHHHAYDHQSHPQFHNHSSRRFNQNYPQHLCYTTSVSSSSSCDPMEFRIGLFCFLYLIPLICMNACDLYEYLYRDKWLTIPDYKHLNDHNTNTNTNNYSNNNMNNNNNRKLMDNRYHNIYGTRNHPEIMNFASYLWNINEVYGPNPELFMLRIFMSLVTGFTCSLWMWTVKGCCCSYLNYDCCLCVTNNIGTLKQKRWENQNLLRNSKIVELTKQNYLCSNELIKNNDNNGNKHILKSNFTRTPDGTTYTLHPYAIYQHTKTPDSYHSQQLGTNGQFDNRFPIIGCCSSTSHTNTTTNPDKNSTNIPFVLTKGHLSQLDTSFVVRDFEHSNSTTPGYYSHAKISPNMIIDSMSEDASASSIPPPLPPSNSRPPRLPARGDPCVGASSSQVFGLNNLDNHITNATMNNNIINCNNNNNNDNSETENYSLIQFQITS